MKRTPLFECHQAAGARMVDFAGWELPVYYTGINQEVRAVRTGVGVFDVSHMGEISLRGDGATATLQNLITNDVSGVDVGSGIYSPMCTAAGGTVDDLIAFRVTPSDWLLVVNASRLDVDIRWMHDHLLLGTTLADASDDTSLMAVQGPASEATLQPLVAADLSLLRRNQWIEADCAGIQCRISRTGYTGGDGFEVFLRPDDASQLWDTLIKRQGAVPCGLGARDVLRLEAALCLYGHELSEDISPLEAGIAWTVKFGKGSFIGKEALLQTKLQGVSRCLVGLEMSDRSVAREGYTVEVDGDEIGRISSGTHSATLGKSIALAFVPASMARPGTGVSVRIRESSRPAQVVNTPFYRPPH